LVGAEPFFASSSVTPPFFGTNRVTDGKTGTIGRSLARQLLFPFASL
jgi:hypothetical protein